MADDHAGHAQLVAGFDNHVVDHVIRNGVQAGGGLVPENVRGILDDRPRQADAFTHPAGKFRGQLIPVGLDQAQQAQLARYAVLDFRRRVLPVLAQRQGHVFENGQALQQGRILEDHAELQADAVQVVLVHARYFFVVDVDLAPRRLHQTDDVFQDRALARTRKPQDRRRAAVFNLQV